MGFLPQRPQAFNNISRQAVLKALCATTILVVFIQIGWYYYSNSSELPVPFHHQTPPAPPSSSHHNTNQNQNQNDKEDQGFEQHQVDHDGESVNHVFSYGAEDCFPAQTDVTPELVQNHTDFCVGKGRKLLDPPPKLAMVTAQFGSPQLHYQRALGTHVLHNAVQRTGVHLLCAKIVDDLWNKPAFLLDLLFAEMEKPEADRLQWIFWVDRDTIVLDTCRSPLSYMPTPLSERPPPQPPANATDEEKAAAAAAAAQVPNADDPADGINMLVTTDWNGLNNGVFLLRVCSWSVDLFIAILAFRYYRPDVELTFTEQSAMEILLKEDKFKDQVVWVPHYWFNAYPRGREKEDFTPLAQDKGAQAYHARRGDFLVHFAGLGQRDKAMNPWLDVAENATVGWGAEKKERFLDQEIEAFWNKWRGDDAR